ncbi:MAG: protein phosphatase 2C domain-containing protein [Lachnospiraceae bacterium]|nr:protein phosphatase 2C domain-containing protein [Lachnospiraceae bacterium]
MECACFSLTNQGGRKANEDCCAVRKTPGGFAVTVADGLGGEGRGDVASKTATETVMQLAEAGKCRTDGEVCEAVRAADAAVKKCQCDACRMMTTLVSLFVEKGEAFWVHVGDSRLYLFEDGRLVRQTLDHSVPQMAVAMGMITPDQIRTHKDRSRILKAVGSEACEPELSEHMVLRQKFYAFLLCTDGFWENVYEEEMESLLAKARNPKMWLKNMEKLLRERVKENQDNYTAVAVFLR